MTRSRSSSQVCGPGCTRKAVILAFPKKTIVRFAFISA
ncbi:hypothetical protein ELH30_16660 [Rhizobium ruizarguesonis]|nr:hypothetical protein ELH30_16660 [Rhizobium ruizarguesonis]